jgi:hypothetical protein
MEGFKGFGGSGNGRKGVKDVRTRLDICSDGLNLIVVGTQGAFLEADPVATHPGPLWRIGESATSKYVEERRCFQS